MDDGVRKRIGILLVAVGALEPLFGIFVVAPRISDPGRRQVVILVPFGSGAFLVALGAMFLPEALGSRLLRLLVARLGGC